MRPILVVIFLLFANSMIAQSPVQWTYTVNKITDKEYEVHLMATVNAPWHIYSQHTPGGGPVPTAISFSKNPIVVIEGNVKETGTLITEREDVFDLDVQYYNKRVDFVQTIKLKAKVKTNINGSVKYMVCNDRECLPPTTVNFAVPIN